MQPVLTIVESTDGQRAIVIDPERVPPGGPGFISRDGNAGDTAREFLAWLGNPESMGRVELSDAYDRWHSAG
jgi:hypothetical protein